MRDNKQYQFRINDYVTVLKAGACNGNPAGIHGFVKEIPSPNQSNYSVLTLSGPEIEPYTTTHSDSKFLVYAVEIALTEWPMIGKVGKIPTLNPREVGSLPKPPPVQQEIGLFKFKTQQPTSVGETQLLDITSTLHTEATDYLDIKDVRALQLFLAENFGNHTDHTN